MQERFDMCCDPVRVKLWMPGNQYEMCKGSWCWSRERAESVWLRLGQGEQGVQQIQTMDLDMGFKDGEMYLSGEEKN